MVNIEFADIVTFISIVASLVASFCALHKSTQTTTDSRRGIVLHQFSEEFRNKNSISNVLKCVYSDSADKLSLEDKIRFIHFYKELYLQVKTNNRMKVDVASFMFLKYAEDVLKCNDFWDSLSSKGGITPEDKAQLDFFVKELKSNRNKPTNKLKI